MNIDMNDPRLTAYALGEITDEKERAELEAAIGEAPELAVFVEEVRETAGWLSAELHAELGASADGALTPAQRGNIEARAAKAASGGILAKLFGHEGFFGNKLAWMPVGAAAVLVLAFFTFRQFQPEAVHDGQTAGLVEDAGHEPDDLATPVLTAQVEEPVAEQRIAEQATAQVDEQVANQATMQTFVAPTAIPMEIPPPAPGELSMLRSQESIARLAQMEAEIRAGKKVNSIIAAAAPAARDDIMELIPTMSGSVAQPDGYPFPSPDDWNGNRPPAGKRSRFNTEDYASVVDNPFLDVVQNPLSTFSIDVDTASYSNVRRFLEGNRRPPKDSVRIEELVNYFDYDYKAPTDGKPFAVNAEMAEAPWNPKHKLLRVALKGRELAKGKRPQSNLVFLVDVSGSMTDYNKLPLVKESMKMLVDRLAASDRVSIVVYAGSSGLALPSTSGEQKDVIRRAIDNMRAGGSTAGAAGIQLAYKVAEENFIKGGVNRVILATDGDFNVGVTSKGDLTRLIEEKAKKNVFLTALGFGMGNYKDPTLELLADKGHGNYAYIDTANEARKVLVEQMDATLVAIAKDVKIQVEFNPARVKSYRLLGYENRIMAKEDFNDDAKQAGVVGAGHAVTAFYELATEDDAADTRPVDPLKYQAKPAASAQADSSEIATVKIRSKAPEGDRSVLTEFAVHDGARGFAAASRDFKFAAAVAAFGMVLRDSPHKGSADYDRILQWANEGKGDDRFGYRAEFIRLVHRAVSIK
ncbi:MAG: von Willebrand factor type A domain-containing protein [Acidobacteriota bacterium]|jgi:Ca-activated chloride channel family protein|nr:von Willebrand factor type A domain-containing protein [Acidobacteriota bacterium]